MKRILFLIALTTAGAANAATLAPKPQELLKSIDAVLGEVPPEPATQKAWEKQKTETDLKRKESVESLATLTRSGGKTWLNELKFDPTKIRHDVEMRGDKTITPVLSFRDERFTYLDYGADNEGKVLPVAYQVVDRVDQPVNVRKSPDGRYLVVKTINPITLRYGEKTVCLKRQSS